MASKYLFINRAFFFFFNKYINRTSKQSFQPNYPLDITLLLGEPVLSSLHEGVPFETTYSENFREEPRGW